MSALVTGATGFIGRRLALRLAHEGERVLCLARDPARASWMRGISGLEPVRGDVRDRALLRDLAPRAATVYHLAGLTSALRRRDFEAVNAEATGALASAAAAVPEPPKVVYASSLAAAGPRDAGHPAREDEPPRPTSPYGRSKLRGEEMLRSEGRGIRWTILRPPWVYGPGDRATLPLFRMAGRGWFPRVRGGCMPLSLLHVDDLVEALVLAGRSPAADGRTYYVTDGTLHTVGELGAALLAAAGGGRAVPVPGFVLRLAGLAGEAAAQLTGRPALLGWHKACEGLAQGWVCDDARIRADLGYRSRVALAEGVAATLAWYRTAGWL